MNELMQRCQGRWFDILQILGGLDRRQLQNKHGPCPMCGGKDRYRWDNKDGRGTWICNVCGSGDGAKLLMMLKSWSFGELVTQIEGVIGRTKVQHEKAPTQTQANRQAMERLWHAASPIESGDPVALYLLQRGLRFQRYPTTLRYHPDLWNADVKAKCPAMLARVDDPAGQMAQLHQTFLTLDGKKADVPKNRKLFRGGAADGVAVRFGKANGSVGIAEGIETALACVKLHKIPVWAALNTSLLMKWRPPKSVKNVFIFGDNDRSYAGQNAAYVLAHRLAMQNADIAVHVCIPQTPGNDWNDEVLPTEGMR